ncbi:MAG TPA: OmpA family protein, partial [Kofleriaceae bacterium]|nr:OmpA family protein [Kofleriaceae bacterium]
VNPLNLESPQVPGQSDALVAGRTAFELSFSYAFAERFEAGVLMPLLQQSGSESMVVTGVAPAAGFALGDLALHGKMSLVAAGPLELGVSTTLTVPTSTSEEFAGVSGATAQARGLVAASFGRAKIAANGGFLARGTGQFGDLEQGNELTYGLAANYRVQRKLWAVGELFGAVGLSDAGSTQGVSPLETALGARYRLTRELGIVGGVGRGILPGIGAPTFRAIVSVAYTPNASDIGVLSVGGPGPGPVAEDTGDDDGDGIINARDECPDEPEDMDGFQDEDGCPDPDNDGDGLADADDLCPNEAEDMDGFKDEDGCPDLDNDEDGIPDSEDKCPDEPEDFDGFQDRDGCDDPDNDGDGIPDVIDQCALEPETINGVDDDDGCPDEGESLVMVMPDRIEVFEPVRFNKLTDKILKSSHNLLGQVAATLRANRDFLRVRIAVHVHPRNNNDLQLSQLRAQAVRKWLVQWGIEPERLEIKGFGSARPLVPKNKRGAAEVNDRIEFIVLEKRVVN